MNTTPQGERVHIGLFGRRNAVQRESGKPGKGSRTGGGADDQLWDIDCVYEWDIGEVYEVVRGGVYKGGVMIS